jgi:hypothetical protein
MSKKNTKSKKFSPYRKYGFNRLFAQALNDDHYETWLIMDEGLPKPYPQRVHNFLVKYGMKNKKTGKSILSYIPKEYLDKMIDWVSMTTSEKNKIRNIAKNKFQYNVDKKIIGWLHQAEIMYFDDIKKYN